MIKRMGNPLEIIGICEGSESFLCATSSAGSLIILLYAVALLLANKRSAFRIRKKTGKRVDGGNEQLKEPLIQNDMQQDLQSLLGISLYKSRLGCWLLELLSILEVVYQLIRAIMTSIEESPSPDALVEHWALSVAGAMAVILLEAEQQTQKKRLSLHLGLLFTLWGVFGAVQMIAADYWELTSTTFWNRAYLIFVGVVAVLNCVVDRDEIHYQSPPPPEFTVGFFSYFTFSYFTPVIKTGTLKQLEFEDLPPVVDQDQAKNCYLRFITAFSRRSRSSRIHSGYKLLSHDESFGDNPRIFRRLLKTVGWPWVMVGALKFTGSCLVYVSPLALQQVTDYVGSYEKGDRIPGNVILAAAALFLVPFVSSIINGRMFNAGQRCAAQVYGALVAAIFKKMSKVDMSATNYSVGELTNLMAVDAQILKDFICYFHFTWCTFVELFICLGLLFWVIGISALGGLVFLIIMLPISKYTTKKVQEYQSALMKAKDERMTVMNEVLSGIHVIKLFAWEGDFLNKIRECRRKEVSFIRSYLYMVAAIIVQWTSTSSLVGLFTFILHTQILKKELTAGDGFSALALFTNLRFPLLVLPSMINRAVQAKVSLGRIEEFLRRKEISETPRLESYTAASGFASDLSVGGVLIRDGEFKWGSCKPMEEKEDGKEDHESKKVERKEDTSPGPSSGPTLSGINLEIQPGSLVCIYGPTGCGKSSLLMAILGEIERVQGMVATRGSIAYASQKAWIQNATVRENILFGREYNELKYRGAIASCALRRDLQILDGGDLTEIGEKGINLSGGQQQRISLARAVYAEADIYVLDDVLSAVDAHVGEHIFNQCIKGALREKTRVLVTHQVALTIRDADYVVLLADDGTIAEQGKPSLLQHGTGRIAEMIKDYGGLREQEEEYRRSVSHQSTKTTEGVKLVKEEERSYGAPGFKVYMAYFRACGGILGFAFPYLLIMAATQGFQFGQNYALTIWVGQIGNGISSGSGLWLYVGISGGLLLNCLARGLLQAYGSLKASQKIHDVMANRVMRAPCSWFESTPLGRIVNRFSSDLLNIDEDLMDTFGGTADLFGQAVAVIFVIGVNLPWLFIPMFFIAWLAFTVSRMYLSTSREIKRLDSISKSPVYAHFSETITGIMTVRAYGETERFFRHSCKKVDENIQAYLSTWISNRWLNVRMENLGAFVSGAAALFVILTVGRIKDTMAGLILTYSIQITGVMAYLIRNNAELEMQINAVERTEEYSKLDQEAPPIISGNQPPQNWPDKGEIRVTNMTLKYASAATPALHHLNFSVPPRTRVGIVGRTGAGKSSLTSALFRLVEPISGSIVIDGYNILNMGLEDLRSRLAIVPQDPVLFRGTVRSNLDPFKRHEDSQMWDALRRVKLSEVISDIPDGLDSDVSEGGTNFSVGQRQLICMARAILRQAAILVMDEATANVDPDTDTLIQDTMKNEFKNCTVLCIAHRLHTIIYYDKVMVLERGNIAEYDAPAVLLEDSSTIFHSLCERSGDLDQLKVTAAESLSTELESSSL